MSPRWLHWPAAAAVGPTLVIHDSFSSSSGSIDTRTPDTVDNGNDWDSVITGPATDFTVDISTSGFVYASTQSTTQHVRIVPGSTTYTIEAVIQVASVAADTGYIGIIVGSTDISNFSRISILADDISQQDVTGGSFTNTSKDTSIGMSAGTDYTATVVVDAGTGAYTFELKNTSTSSVLSSISGTTTYTGSAGLWFRRSTTATHCSDFKVYN